MPAVQIELKTLGINPRRAIEQIPAPDHSGDEERLVLIGHSNSMSGSSSTSSATKPFESSALDPSAVGNG